MDDDTPGWTRTACRLSRRAYLAISGASAMGLAGCQGGSDGGDTTETTADATETPTTTATATQAESQSDDGGDEYAAEVASLAEFTFEGSWCDTHAHWGEGEFLGGEDFTIDDLSAVLSQHDIGASVLFVLSWDWRSNFEQLTESMAQADADFLPFLGPGEQMESVYEGRDEMFYGVGEIPFYAGSPQYGLSFSDEPVASNIKFAASNDLVLMLHPTMDQADDIEPTLSEYPDLDLLLHGQELTGTDVLLDLLETYENLYFTFDLGGQIGGLWETPDSATEFIERFEAERSWYLRGMAGELSPMLEVAPNQVMWGTDIAVDWHTDPAFYEVIMDFSEDLLQELPAEHRDPYAYENAVALFGG